MIFIMFVGKQAADVQLVCKCATEREALRRVREVLMYLPASNTLPAPMVRSDL